jgi:hypothetical protein
LVLLVATLAFAGCSDFSGHGAREVVDGFLEAYNARQAAAAASYFAPGAVLSEAGGPELRGRDAILSKLAWDSVLAASMGVGGYDVRDDSLIVGRVAERNAGLVLLGIDELRRTGPNLFLIQDGRIVSLELAALDAESTSSLEAAMRDFVPWAHHEYPDRLQRIRPAGFEYSARRAADWLSLLREWRTGVR